jgi:hypothetical protein
MRGDGDFDAFLAARWPRVVRALVLLGGPPGEAERVARTAFARLRPAWGRSTDEPEVHAWREVLEVWRGRVWTPPGEPAPARVAALEPALDRLTPDARAALVLRAVAGLDAAQVALVLQRPGSSVGTRTGIEPPGEAEVLAAAEEVEVSPAPTAQALSGAPGAAAARRRRRPGTVVAAAALALLVGVGTWLGTRPAEEPTAVAPRVTRVENTAEVAWWANNVLHLPHVDVELPRVTDLVEIDDGAVFGDEEGRVSVVSRDGVVTRLGHKAPREPLVGSDDTGWAAWVDPTGDAPRLVVQDVTAGARLATRELSAGAEVQPIAFDHETLYYADAQGNWQWHPGQDDPLRVLQPGLLDVADATEARQLDPRRLELVQPFFNIVHVVPGEDAQLSPDATYALTRAPGTGRRGQLGRVRLYDVRSGDRLWTGLTRSDVAVAATLGPDDEVHYVIAHRGDLPQSGEYVRSSFSGPYELRTCHIGERTCFTVGRFPHTGALPVLAR